MKFRKISNTSKIPCISKKSEYFEKIENFINLRIIYKFPCEFKKETKILKISKNLEKFAICNISEYLENSKNFENFRKIRILQKFSNDFKNFEDF